MNNFNQSQMSSLSQGLQDKLISEGTEIGSGFEIDSLNEVGEHILEIRYSWEDRNDKLQKYCVTISYHKDGKDHISDIEFV